MSPSGTLCRFCGGRLGQVLADLGLSPLANDFIPPERADEPESFHPLRAAVCDDCRLVQLDRDQPPRRIFADDYAYYSSYSTSWLAHCAEFAGAAVRRFGLDGRSRVVEVASNDGHLLACFLEHGISVLGVEPSGGTARAALSRGVPTVEDFFGTALATTLAETARADLLVGNNVLPHVPDLNDFVAGLAVLLAERGTLVLEFQHLLRLLEEGQYDTIYHEHFSYFSLTTARRVLGRHGLELVDVEEIPTHGGSLRVFAQHAAVAPPPSERVVAVLAAEESAGLDGREVYDRFGAQVGQVKRDLLRFLIDAAEAGHTVAGYGAPAKGNTLLNHCGVGPDLVPYVVDASPHKQGLLLPGSRIPVLHPSVLADRRPDYVLILPWNLRTEIVEQLAYVREWGGRFVVRTPALSVLG